MAYRAKDLGRSTLAGGINSSVTSLTVQTGHGDRFPVIASPDDTEIILKDGSGNFEIIRVQARSSGSDTLSTLTRGYRGTTARSWGAGTPVALHVPAARVEQAINDRAEHEAASDPHSQYVLEATANLAGTIAALGDISPTQITANQNDYNPSGLSLSSTLRLDSDADRTITGLQGGSDGRLIAIHNIGAFTITLTAEDAASAAGNRFANTYYIRPKRGIILQYDTTSQRWRFFGTTLSEQDLVTQRYVAATTAGTAPNFTLTPNLAFAALAVDRVFRIKFHANGAGSDQLNISGLGNKALKYLDDQGNKVAFVPVAGYLAYIEYDGTDYIVLNPPIKSALGDIPAVRQTVLSGPLDANGLPAFGGVPGSNTLTLTGTTLRVTAASGTANRTANISNPAWSGLSVNGTMFLYLDIGADGVMTSGATSLPPIYQHGGTPSIVSGQHTFNVQEMKMYVGNGASAAQAYRVFVGEVDVASNVVSAIRWYALMGRYESPWTATLPAPNTTTTVAHNLGMQPKYKNFVIECTATDVGYVVGDQVNRDDMMTANASGILRPHAMPTDRTNVSLICMNLVEFSVVNKSTRAVANLTNANWKYKFVAERGW